MTPYEVVEDYLGIFPEERQGLALLLDQLREGECLNDRKNFRGHITGAGIVLSPNRRKILLVHHRFLNKWLQPGGHWDAADENSQAAARREVGEETSAHLREQLSPFDDPLIPIDIQTHPIPAQPAKNEPAHYHHDFRYVFLAAGGKLLPLESELNICTWVDFNDPRVEHVRPIIAKLRRFEII